MDKYRSTLGMAAGEPFEGNQQAAVGRTVSAQIKRNARCQISDAMFDAQNLVARIRQMTGMLCGHEAEEAENCSPPDPEGILPSLAETAARTSRMIRTAQGELDRLQSHFE